MARARQCYTACFFALRRDEHLWLHRQIRPKNDIHERRKLTVTSETDGMECDTSENLVNNDVVPPHALLHSLP